MEQEMTAARSPLVLEIEDFASRSDSECEAAEAQRIVTSWAWPRIRAALEAAEEMAEHAGKATDAPGLWMAAKRYRAATRGE